MDQEYISLTFDSGEKKDIELQLKTIDRWNENRIKALSFGKTNTIVSVIVGPKTVLEYYPNGDFSGSKKSIINDGMDNQKIEHTFGTPLDSEVWVGNPKSFIIWTYDLYKATYGTRYCSSDSQCKSTEYCMCATGQTHPSNCPSSKRRCRDKGYFWYEFPFQVRHQDQLDVKCVDAEMKMVEKTGIDDNQMSDALLNDLARRCAKERMKTIEPFGTSMSLPMLSATLFVLFLIICVLFPIGLL